MVLCLLFSIGLCANFVPVRSRAANYVYATQRIVDVEAIRVAAATSGDDTQLAIRTEISGAYIYVSGGRANEGCPKIAKIRCVDGMFVNGVNIQMGELPNKNDFGLKGKEIEGLCCRDTKMYFAIKNGSEQSIQYINKF